ncbi:Phosphatidate phosphatase APP1 [Exophiala dermatitidis]
MSIPSVLEYARFHGLSTDHRSENLLAHLCHVSRSPEQETAADNARLLEATLGTLASPVDEPRLQLGHRETRLLAESIADVRPAIDWNIILPDPYRWRKLRIEEPLLATDHDLDVAAFRRDAASRFNPRALLKNCVSLQTAPDEQFKDEWTDKDGDHSLNDIQRKLNNEKLQVTRESLKILAATRYPNATKDEREALANAEAPQKPQLPPSSPLLAIEETLPEDFSPQATELNIDLPPAEETGLDEHPQALEEATEDQFLAFLEASSGDLLSNDSEHTRARPGNTPSARIEIDLTLLDSSTLSAENASLNPRPTQTAPTDGSPGRPMVDHQSESFQQGLSSPKEPASATVTADCSRSDFLFESKHDASRQPSPDWLECQSAGLNKDSDDDLDSVFLILAEQANEEMESRLNRETNGLSQACANIPTPSIDSSTEGVAHVPSKSEFLARHIDLVCLGTADPPISQNDKRLDQSVIPPDYTYLSLEERVDDCQYHPELGGASGDVIRSEQLLWKQPGLRILDDDESSDDELQEDMDLAALVSNPTQSLIPQKRAGGDRSSPSAPMKALVGNNEPEIAIKPAPKRNVTESASVFSVSSALESFLDLRGSKFKSSGQPSQQSMDELPDDPIESTQPRRQQEIGPVVPSLAEQNAEFQTPRVLVPATPLLPNTAINSDLPTPSILEWQKTVIVDTALLQTHRPLTTYMARQGADQLTIIYRDLSSTQRSDKKLHSAVPDIILNPRACLTFTNFQDLTQKGLPGQDESGDRSIIQRKILILLQEYDSVFVLVMLKSHNATFPQAACNTINQFSGFCSSITVGSPGLSVLSTLAPPFRGLSKFQNTLALFRYLFPNTHRRAREKFLALRHEHIPRLRLRAQSRIYRAIVRRQQKKQEKRAAGKGFIPFLQRWRKSRILQALYGKHHAGVRQLRGTRSTDQMTSYGQPGGRVPGSRREKLRGIIRAANELRQTYQEQLQHRLQESETNGGMPGDFPDVEIIRGGDEEMILFPSYARKHTKKKTNSDDTVRYPPGTHESVETPHSTGDAEYWRREWEKYEDANAIIDVDVRGWIYSPQRGPLNRRNRLLLAVARRLSGVYAPPPAPTVSSRPSSLPPNSQEELDESPSRHEDEIAAREAENIARRGQLEAEAAGRGSYTQLPRSSFDNDSPAGSRSGSPAPSAALSRRATEAGDDDPVQQGIQKRQSWNESAKLSREEMAAANEMLLTRLRPFMSNPVANTPITIFFFNEQRSASKSITTDDSGHFNLRAALDFIPTQVRVLVSEKLSATQDVIITDSRGVSLISDIDDTIKHSGIAAGAREIFKNTFVRELTSMTIEGVREWYTTLAEMGVKLHYVSNSPWQLYPLLRSYFALAGLPPGSFHLKQYSGMLQGIFEPAAERKRGSLERIMNDFPERRFILVGDSGEADLEVYTDVVLEHPGQVLGVFIRDVTTPIKKAFFDQTPSNAASTVSVSSKNGSRLEVDTPNDRPPLPARPKSDPEAKTREVDLIDFSDESDTKGAKEETSHSDDMRQLEQNGKPAAPNKPNKPSSLRNFSTQSLAFRKQDRSVASDPETQEQEESKKKAPPPPKPRRSGAAAGSEKNTETAPTPPVPPPPRAPFSSTRQNQGQPQANDNPVPPPPVSRTNTSTSTVSSLHSRTDDGYVASARRQIASAYNALPAIRSSSPSRPADQTGISSDNRPAPPIPPRRGLSSYPAAAARWATGATGGDPAAGGDAGYPGASYDKKLEIWKRRWARSEEIMRQRGVVLRSWRVGSDVMDECVNLVKKELQRIEHSRSSDSTGS